MRLSIRGVAQRMLCILACALSFMVMLGSHPLQAFADDKQSQTNPTLTIHVLDNGASTGATGIEGVAEMLPKDAKPVGAGYVYSLTKLNFDAVQTLVPSGEPVPNKEATDKVVAKLSDYIDKTNGIETIHLGSTDSQGSVTVGSQAKNGIWLKDASYDGKAGTITGGSPATFSIEENDGVQRKAYWLLQLVAGPKEVSATADPSIITMPGQKTDGSPEYNVVSYPKVQTKPVPGEPIQPTPPNKAPIVPVPPKKNPGSVPTKAPIRPDPSKDCPNCVSTGTGTSTAYRPSGHLVATGSAVTSLLTATSVLLIVALAIMYSAKRYTK
ncbi:hypothetical protein [Bombiscardovia coagulans]|nr:hypothetical protein [Bombiscardovia coagulans]